MAEIASVSDYVDLPFVVDPTQIADDAIEALRARWPGWEPNDGDIEVGLIEAIAPMAADVALICAAMPAAALRAFGTKILGLVYGIGAPAGTTVRFDVIDTAGYTIPSGAQFEIDGFAFAVFLPAVIAPGASDITGVQVYASGVPTAAANGLTGARIAQLSLPPFVTGVTVETATAGGLDPQTDSDFQSMVSREQRLRAKTLVTARDFELEALDFSAEIGRAQSSFDTARAVTVTVATHAGGTVSSGTKTALGAHYDTFAQVNTVYTIADPTYTTVNIVWHVKALPGPFVDLTQIETSINALLAANLDPSRFGSPGQGDPSSISNWIPETKVRLNDVIAWIKPVTGVNYVISVLINGSAADLTLTGTVPLPTVGTISGTVDP